MSDAPLVRPDACEFCDRPFGRFVMVYRWQELWVCRHCRGWLKRMERWQSREKHPQLWRHPSSDG